MCVLSLHERKETRKLMKWRGYTYLCLRIRYCCTICPVRFLCLNLILFHAPKNIFPVISWFFLVMLAYIYICGSEWNVNNYWLDCHEKYYNTHVPLMMYHKTFGNPSTFHLVPTSGQNSHLSFVFHNQIHAKLITFPPASASTLHLELNISTLSFWAFLHAHVSIYLTASLCKGGLAEALA